MRIWYKPISVEKCTRIVDPENGNRIVWDFDYISPNEMEMVSLLTAMGFPGKIAASPSMGQWEEYCRFVIDGGVRNVILSMGSKGVLVAMGNGQCRYIKVDELKPTEIINTNGAGDNLCGSTICGLLEGKELIHAVEAGICASKMCLRTKYAVHPELTKEVLTRSPRRQRSNL